MGSFSYTCCVSGLGIDAGDPVRYFLLTENPYDDSAPCYMHDLWFPRTYPLKGRYNDYGSVEGIETGPQRDIWLEGLRLDLVERGWGDNTCHDVPTSRNMTFDALLRALVERRVQVRRDHKRLKEPKYELPAGVPTRKRVEQLLVEQGLRLFNGDWGRHSYAVDTRRHGVVRVRVRTTSKDFGKDAVFLRELQPLFGQYATMVSAAIDSGNYEGAAELRIAPHPETKGYHGSPAKRDKPLRVEHVMIREDVWQALLRLKVQNGYEEDRAVGIEKYYEDANQYVEAYRTQLKSLEGLAQAVEELGGCTRDVESVITALMTQPHLNTPVGSLIASDAIPFTVGLGTHFKLMLKKEICDEAFIRTAAEFAFVHRVLAPIRYWWRPSYSIGPQWPEWGDHVRFCQAIFNVANRLDETDRVERAKAENDEEE